MRVYIEAYDTDGLQILGNLDGQTAFSRVVNYRKTAHYRALKAGNLRVAHNVSHWRIVNERGDILETILRNPSHL